MKSQYRNCQRIILSKEKMEKYVNNRIDGRMLIEDVFEETITKAELKIVVRKEGKVVVKRTKRARRELKVRKVYRWED